VYFRQCEIDHIIPLDAVRDQGQAATVRELYALPQDFDFDWFNNWVPACGACTGTKSFTTIDPSPSFALHLTSVRSRAPLAERTADAVDANASKARILAQVSAAVERGALSHADITELFQGLPWIVRKSDAGGVGAQPQEILQIAPGWSVIEERGHLRVVTDGKRAGMTSSSGDPSWVCSNCGHKGPWNGIVCMSCGNREEPD
jgi:hypothetical protein